MKDATSHELHCRYSYVAFLKGKVPVFLTHLFLCTTVLFSTMDLTGNTKGYGIFFMLVLICIEANTGVKY